MKHIFKSIIIFLLVNTSALAQPIEHRSYFGFQLVDEHGNTIYPNNPEFDSYQLTLRLGTNANNSADEVLGSYDKIVIGDRKHFAIDNDSRFSITWQSSNSFPAVEFIELVIKHGNDSMYLELTGQMKQSFVLDSVKFKPGYSYYISLFYPYNQTITSGVYYSNLFKAKFVENDFITIKPLDNYTPITVVPTISIDETYLNLTINTLMGKSTDYINVATKVSGNTINLELKNIVIEKNGFYGRGTAGMGGPISTHINLKQLKSGKYKLVVRLDEKQETYWLYINDNEVELITGSKNTILKNSNSPIIRTN